MSSATVDARYARDTRATLRTSARVSLTTIAWFVATLATTLIALDSSLGTLRRVVLVGLLIVVAAADAFLQARQHAGWTAVLRSVSGVVGVSICAGYLTSHLLEGDIATAVGAAGAVAWLLVTLAGLVYLVRSSSWLVRILLVVVALLVAQFVVLPFAAGTSGSHPPRIPLTTPTPPEARDVSFPAADGVPIGGWYVPGRNGGALILLPGSGGNREDVWTQATVLAHHGYAVLAIDARGSGASGGIGNLWGWYGVTDVGGAIDWLESQPGVDASRIGLVGESMGGEQAITVAALDERVRAVVAEGVQGRVPGDMWYVGDDARSLVERSISTIVWGVAAAWSEVPVPQPLREVVASLDVPTLIIAADAPDERAVSADLAGRRQSIEVWQTTGIGHVQSLALAPEEWERRVTTFLEASLTSE
jgi:pimeloyl-ACP methyl ester carboxylesterase